MSFSSEDGQRPPLTHGSVTRNLVRLALPATASFLLSNLFTLIDTFWVARLGAATVGGVTMAGIILSVVFTIASGLAVGVEALVSRAWGQGDAEAARRYAAQGWLVGGGLTLLFTVAGYFLAGPILGLFSLPPRIEAEGTAYLEVMALGMGTIFLLMPVSASLRAVGDTVSPMKSLALSAVLNILLDPVLIFGWGPVPAMGGAGAALATVLARCVGLLYLSFLVFHRQRDIRPAPDHFRPEARALRLTFTIGRWATLMMLFYDASSLALMGIVAEFGEATVAAYGIVARLFLVVLMPGFGFAGAVSALVGQNLGAAEPGRARATALSAVKLYGGVTLLLSVPLTFLGEPVMSLFAREAEVVAIGGEGLLLYAPSFVFVIVSIFLGRAMSGAGDTVTPMLIAGVSQLLVRVPLAVVMAWAWQETGLWLSLALSNIINAGLSFLFFRRGRWLHVDPLGTGAR